MKSIAIFCGSAIGRQPSYRRAVSGLVASIAANDMKVVYGGGNVGLMGELADQCQRLKVPVTGVMPNHLIAKELLSPSLDDVIAVDSMHERKQEMADRADAFLALPGGSGTFEEILEQWTWSQLGVHRKPCGFLNVAGYFDPFLKMCETMTQEGFLKPAYLEMLVVSADPEDIIHRFQNYQAPSNKWT